MVYLNIVKELVFQYIEHDILRYDFVSDIRYVFVSGTSTTSLDFWVLQDNDYNVFRPSIPFDLTH